MVKRLSHPGAPLGVNFETLQSKYNILIFATF